MAVLGWDIGGSNTKVARVDAGTVRAVHARPFEVRHSPSALPAWLRERAAAVGAGPDDAHAVTMTAELSRCFRTLRAGVAFVLDAVVTAFPRAPLRVYTTGDAFVDADTARAVPLDVAAANWVATAAVVARTHRDALLVDVGTTTTDIVPIVDGRPVAAGWTDFDRLAVDELVYTGAVRTPVEAMVSRVTVGGVSVGVAAEAFALSGDVHVWRGALDATDYTCPTPDGQPVTRVSVHDRLARVVCADADRLTASAIDDLARCAAEAQVARVADAMARVHARAGAPRVAVVAGVGAFIAAAAARRLGLDVVSLAGLLGADAARHAPAACVALLLDRRLHASG